MLPSGIQLIQYNLPEKNYFRQETKKSQIVLHHTANNGSATSVIDYWASRLNGSGTIATCVVIDKFGVVYQAFSSKYWANNIGVGKKSIERGVIGIEIASWGGLRYRNKAWRSYAGVPIKKDNIIFYDNQFRGYSSFERYTDAQIKATVLMVKYFSEKYEIPITFDYDNVFNYSEAAISEKPGLYSHASFRKDKSDCHPQPNLIDELKRL